MVLANPKHVLKLSCRPEHKLTWQNPCVGHLYCSVFVPIGKWHVILRSRRPFGHPCILAADPEEI